MRRSSVVSITSGKGGVGKSTLTCNLALALSQKNKRVLILDGDLGMANVDIMFGVRASGNIHDVLRGEKTMQEILLEVSKDVFVIPGGNGVYELNHLNSFQRRSIMEAAQSLPLGIDYLLIDTAPGIDDNVLYLNSAAQIVTVVLTPDPSSFTDAYSLIKMLHQRNKVQKFQIVCNQVRDSAEGIDLFKRFSEVAHRFMNVGLDYFGSIPMDVILRKAVQSQRLIIKHDPTSIGAIAIREIANQIERKHVRQHHDGIQDFWEQVVGMNQ